MLDDLTKEIKAQLYERVKSPLFGAFALSWVAWNYRPLLAVTSGMTFQEKLTYLDSLYPSTLSWLTCSLGAPLLTAVLFLLAYPYPARWIYRYWANQHKELKKVQQEIEDETPMTQEEAKALRKASLAQVMEAQGQLRDMAQTNRELNERLKAATDESLRLVSERGAFEQAAKKAEEQLSPRRTALLTPARAHIRKAVSLDAAKRLYSSLSTDMKGALGERFGTDQTILDVFLLLVAAGGEAYADLLSDYLDANPIDIKFALSVLARDGVAEETNGGAYTLTDEGASIAQELNLTKILPRVTF